MKVVSLTIENVKKIRHMVITPTAWVVKIAGRNGAGKTTALESLMYAFEGNRNIPGTAINDMAKKGSIAVDVGDYKVLKSITSKGQYLTVVDKNGETQGGQDFLNKLLGENSTDATSFLTMKPKEQNKILAKLSGSDTTAIDAEIKKGYDERTVIGRDRDRLQGQLAGMTYTDGLPTEETPASAIIAELDKVKAHNAALADACKDRQHTGEMIAQLGSEIEHLKNQIAEKEKRKVTLEKQAADIDMRLLGEEPQDAAVFADQLLKIDATNKAIRENNDRVRVSHDLQKKRLEYDAKTEFIDEKEGEKKKIIQNAKFPVDGLALGDEEPFYKGRPLSEACGADKIIVGIAILAKIIPADGLRVLRADDGSNLDKESQKKICEIAEREQVQVWLSFVCESAVEANGDMIYIENGEAVA